MPLNPLLLQTNIQKQNPPIQTRQALQRRQRQNNSNHGHYQHNQANLRPKNTSKPRQSKKSRILRQYKSRSNLYN